MSSLAADTAIQYAASEAAKKTFFAGIMTALAWPATIMSALNYIDNSWSIACTRGDKAGVILAEVLESRIHGNNPVTLIGYSTGARLIFNCLLHLKTPGIVENVILIGAPVSNDPVLWKKAKAMVSNEMINAYSSKDWALRLLFRADQFAIGCAGITPVPFEKGVNDCGVTQVDTCQAHFALQDKLCEILRMVGVEE